MKKVKKIIRRKTPKVKRSRGRGPNIGAEQSRITERGRLKLGRDKK